MPSKRVQEAERKLQLVNDSQVEEMSATKVTCKLCHSVVQLSEEEPFDLTNWTEHKQHCSAVVYVLLPLSLVKARLTCV